MRWNGLLAPSKKNFRLLARRLLLALATVVVSAGLLLWLADLGWIREAVRILLQADPLMLPPTVLLMWLIFGFAAERFRRVVMVLRLAAEARFPVFYAINLLTMFAAVVAPVGLAADFARAGLLPLILRSPPGGSALAVFQDKMLGVIGVMAVALPLLCLQPAFGIPLAYVWVQLGVYACCISGALLLQVLAPRLSSGHPALGRLLWFLRSWTDQLSTLRRFAAQLLLAVASIACLAMILWCLGLAIDLPGGSFPLMASIAPALYLAQSMPFTYAGWGAREAVAILLLGTVPGVEPPQAVALSFAFGAIITVASLPGALVPFVLASARLTARRDRGAADPSEKGLL